MYTKNVDHNLIIEPKFTFLSFLLPQYSIFSLVYLEIPWYAFWALNLDSILLDVAWMLLTLFFYIVLTLKGSCSHLSKKKGIFTNYSVNISVHEIDLSNYHLCHYYMKRIFDRSYWNVTGVAHWFKLCFMSDYITVLGKELKKRPFLCKSSNF